MPRISLTRWWTHRAADGDAVAEAETHQPLQRPLAKKRHPRLARGQHRQVAGVQQGIAEALFLRGFLYISEVPFTRTPYRAGGRWVCELRP